MSVVSDSVWPHRQQPTRLPRPGDSPGKNTGVGCHFLLQCMKVKRESEVAQSCPTLSDPMDCSPPGSSIHGSFQARILEWGAIAFSISGGLPRTHFNSLGQAWREGSRFTWKTDCRARGSDKRPKGSTWGCCYDLLPVGCPCSAENRPGPLLPALCLVCFLNTSVG